MAEPVLLLTERGRTQDNLVESIPERGMHYVGTYQDYLHSPYWRARRKRALYHAGRRCEDCGATSRLEVHHRTYIRLGCELDTDLAVLCGTCHASAHGRVSTPIRDTRNPEPIGSIIPRALAAWGLTSVPHRAA